MRVHVNNKNIYAFFYSFDGTDFKPTGKEFTAVQEVWIGAKVGLFNINPNIEESKGYSDFDWFRVE